MIDKDLQQQLRERFNPDGSDLRRLQLEMLKMLVWFDDFCKKHDIRYWISSGTLIGAVRHGGYIPWDDDLDIDMMREDYEKLKKAMFQEEHPDYVLQDNESDPGYFFSYGKLRHKHSLMEETNRYDRIFNMKGMFMDILTFEKMPRILNKIACLSVGHCYKILNRKGISDEKALRKVQRIYAFNKHLLFPILRLLAKLSPTKWRLRSPGIPYKSRTTEAEVFPLSHVEFEGYSFPAPRDTHSYLTRMYGDYMHLPDLENLHPHFTKYEIYK